MSDKDKTANNKKKFYGKRNSKSKDAVDDSQAKGLLDIRSTDPMHAKEWLNAKSLRANELYPKLGNLFINLKYPLIPDVKVPRNYDQMSKAEQFLWQEQVKDRNKDVRHLDLAKSSLFAEMVAAMSKDSIDQVKQSVVKKSIQASRDAHDMERDRRAQARQTIRIRNKVRKAKAMRDLDRAAQAASTADGPTESAGGGKKKPKAAASSSSASSASAPGLDEEDDLVPDNDDDLGSVDSIGSYAPEKSEDIFLAFTCDTDPLELAKHIRVTHIMGKSSNTAEDRVKAEAKFVNLIQSKRQSLERYMQI